MTRRDEIPIPRSFVFLSYYLADHASTNAVTQYTFARFLDAFGPFDTMIKTVRMGSDAACLTLTRAADDGRGGVAVQTDNGTTLRQVLTCKQVLLWVSVFRGGGQAALSELAWDISCQIQRFAELCIRHCLR